MEFDLPIGTLLCSSNLNPQDNRTPGIVNHLAIIIDEEHNMVEAQEADGVIITSWLDYRARPYNWSTFGVLYPRNKETGKKAAEYAKTLVGRRYGTLASIRKNTRKVNCASVIGKAYSNATGFDVQMAIPDDAMRYVNIFTDKLSEVN